MYITPAGVGSKSAILRLQSYSGVQCGSGVFFKMAALITSLHAVVQGFIEKLCRATINLDKDTRTILVQRFFSFLVLL